MQRSHCGFAGEALWLRAVNYAQCEEAMDILRITLG